MVSFVRDKPVRTRGPKVVVDAGLPPGRHRFQLEVIDDAGLRSAPALIRVVVARRSNDPPTPQPSPPIRAATPRRPRRQLRNDTPEE